MPVNRDGFNHGLPWNDSIPFKIPTNVLVSTMAYNGLTRFPSKMPTNGAIQFPFKVPTNVLVSTVVYPGMIRFTLG